MTKQKVIDVAMFYSDWAIKRSSYFVESDVQTEQYIKIVDMSGKIIDFIQQERIEKAMRWLGFIQGMLFMMGDFTVDELKSHNRKQQEIKTQDEMHDRIQL